MIRFALVLIGLVLILGHAAGLGLESLIASTGLYDVRV
jgi:hypothetical protein